MAANTPTSVAAIVLLQMQLHEFVLVSSEVVSMDS